jgi:hypothetical protein
MSSPMDNEFGVYRHYSLQCFLIILINVNLFLITIMTPLNSQYMEFAIISDSKELSEIIFPIKMPSPPSLGNSAMKFIDHFFKFINPFLQFVDPFYSI